jgi:predicted RNase H-like nuclease
MFADSPSNRIMEAGAVLGVDIGWSRRRRSNAICRLDWDSTTASFECSRASLPERSQVLQRMIDRPLLGAAFDGPLRSDLGIIGKYRFAGRLLTRRLQDHIGKPGQSSAPIGKLLNAHANASVAIVLATNKIGNATHDHAIHRSAVVEAFPSSFLGVLLKKPGALRANRAHRSDIFYNHLAQIGDLLKLLRYLLPGRRLTTSLKKITHHDERAAVVCALTALCVVAGDYTVVGDEQDGWIVLPPRSFIQPWAWEMLLENARHGGLDFRPT